MIETSDEYMIATLDAVSIPVAPDDDVDGLLAGAERAPG